MVKQVYQASDGSTHEDKKEAIRRDFEIAVGKAAILVAESEAVVDASTSAAAHAAAGAALCAAFNIRQKTPPATGG